MFSFLDTIINFENFLASNYKRIAVRVLCIQFFLHIYYTLSFFKNQLFWKTFLKEGKKNAVDKSWTYTWTTHTRGSVLTNYTTTTTERQPHRVTSAAASTKNLTWIPNSSSDISKALVSSTFNHTCGARLFLILSG